MRSTSPYSTWLEVAPRAPIRLTYLGEQTRRTSWARPGALLAERYQLEAPLAARTPMTLWQGRRVEPAVNEGAVHEPAVHELATSPRDSVTLQLLDPALVEDPGMLQAFLLEAHAAARIDNPQVARVLDYGVAYALDAGVPFLVLEPLVGETLADRLCARHRLSVEELSGVLGQAARGLEALHDRGLVHRRFDPAHVFLSTAQTSPCAQILFAIDEVFGDNLCLVRKLSHQWSGEGRGQERRARLDTAEYQSPEQLLGHELIDERSDLWSLAVIAFEALTGTPAFGGASLGDRLVQICSGEPNHAPADVSLPPGFDAWFQKGVHKLPAERFSSAREMADALALVFGA